MGTGIKYDILLQIWNWMSVAQKYRRDCWQPETEPTLVGTDVSLSFQNQHPVPLVLAPLLVAYIQENGWRVV